MARHSIQHLREARGESRDDLAQALGVPTETVVDWETGKGAPTAEGIRRLVDHFGIHEQDLDLRPEHPPAFFEQIEDVF